MPSSASGPLLELGLDLEHHAVLVGLGEDGRDQALAEGVVERVVDGRRRDAEAAGGVAVDVDDTPAGPLSCRSLATSASCGQLRAVRSTSRGTQSRELVGVGVLER